VVALPACPDWTGEPGANTDNRQLRNWSCSTAVNLGMMIADPSDLLLGRNPGYADGEYLARSVELYRKGRTRDLIRDAASGEIFPSAAPSSSSSGNGN
jgi:pilus assembly protein CpaD